MFWMPQPRVIHSYHLKIHLIYHSNRHYENVPLGVFIFADSPYLRVSGQWYLCNYKVLGGSLETEWRL